MPHINVLLSSIYMVKKPMKKKVKPASSDKDPAGIPQQTEPSRKESLLFPIAGIGVILSGMGSDGTMELKAIKEKSGLVVVQEPATTKFDSMPRSAIDAGLADIVAPAEELPGKIVAYLRHAPIIVSPTPALEEKEQSALEKVIILLRAKTGHDFSQYKKNTTYRRIERRMAFSEKQITTADGGWFTVRIMPYRTLENLIDGVVMTFSDITAAKKLEAELREEIARVKSEG